MSGSDEAVQRLTDWADDIEDLGIEQTRCTVCGGPQLTGYEWSQCYKCGRAVRGVMVGTWDVPRRPE